MSWSGIFNANKIYVYTRLHQLRHSVALHTQTYWQFKSCLMTDKLILEKYHMLRNENVAL